MKTFNLAKVSVTGKLAGDIEMKYAPDGTETYSGKISILESKKDEEKAFVSYAFTVFGAAKGKFVADLKKGDIVEVTSSSPRHSLWQGQDGTPQLTVYLNYADVKAVAIFSDESSASE